MSAPDYWCHIYNRGAEGCLHRAHAGEDPDLLYAEHYANSDVEREE